MMAVDFDAVRRANLLPQVAGELLKLQRAGREWKACCPFHADRSPSFTIFAGGERFHCFGCGADGDVIDFMRRVHGVGLRTAADMLGASAPPGPAPERRDVLPWWDVDGERQKEARRIWHIAEPGAGTLAERYLRSRGLHLPVPPTVRFTRLAYGKKGQPHPCLIACVVNMADPAGPRRSIAGIQRTYLNEAGTGKAALPKPKLSLGQISGGAIRCAPAAAELIVTEGLEDGLTLQQELGMPAWVAAGASMMPAMQFPACVRSIIVGADGDEAGEAAARKAAETFASRGLAVRIIRPAPGFKDFNDELRGGCA